MEVRAVSAQEFPRLFVTSLSISGEHVPISSSIAGCRPRRRTVGQACVHTDDNGGSVMQGVVVQRLVVAGQARSRRAAATNRPPMTRDVVGNG